MPLEFPHTHQVSEHQEPQDWYLKEWMAHFNKRQSSLINELGWLKARASKYWNGHHDYRREVVNEIAAWLGLEPYELLMPPERALAIRRFRETAEQIVAAGDRFLPQATLPLTKHRTGTEG